MPIATPSEATPLRSDPLRSLVAQDVRRVPAPCQAPALRPGRPSLVTKICSSPIPRRGRIAGVSVVR
jgi:hypothetical protein